MWQTKLLTISVILFQLFHGGQSYFITVDAHDEECFFDKVEAGTKMGK